MSSYERLLRESHGFTLGTALEFAQDEFQEAFFNVWGPEASSPPAGMDVDEWLAVKRVYGMAQQVASVARQLLKRKGVGPQKLQVGTQLASEARDCEQDIREIEERLAGLMSADELNEVQRFLNTPSATDPRTRRTIFENTLQIEATRLLPRTLDEVAVRLEKLAEYVVAARGERTNAYLARVATCYCLDLRTELAVMARAVLDAALEEIARDEDVRQADRSLAASSRVQLGHRLKYLATYDLLFPGETAAMEAIKVGGDDAIHFAPGMEPKSDTILVNLATALGAVERLVGGRSRD